jgi:putative protein kinase ArgK-like GTPase of G3E family
MDQGLPEQLVKRSLEGDSTVVAVAVSLEESRSASAEPQSSEQLMRSWHEQQSLVEQGAVVDFLVEDQQRPFQLV